MKQVAVLGASSMLGKALCQQLAVQGVAVIRVGRDADADVQLDLADEDFVLPEEHIKAEIFFHCAASFGGEDEIGIAQNLKVNTNSALMVVRLAVKLGCSQLIYAGTLSSDPDFDSAGYSSYGLSKALAEQQYAWLLKRIGIIFCTLRFTGLYDTFGQCIRHQSWFGRAVTYAAKGAELHLPEASAKRNYLHVDDAAYMLLKAATRRVVGVFNALHPHTITMLEFVSLAYQIFQRGGRYQCDFTKTPFRDIHYPEGNRCWESLEYVPQITLEKTFMHIKQHGLDDRFDSFSLS